MSYPPLIDPSTTRFNAAWEVAVRQDWQQRLRRGLPWFNRQERRLILRLRLKFMHYNSRQWTLFGEPRRLRRKQRRKR